MPFFSGTFPHEFFGLVSVVMATGSLKSRVPGCHCITYCCHHWGGRMEIWLQLGQAGHLPWWWDLCFAGPTYSVGSCGGRQKPGDADQSLKTDKKEAESHGREGNFLSCLNEASIDIVPLGLLLSGWLCLFLFLFSLETRTVGGIWRSLFCYVCTWICVPQHACGGARITCGSQFSPVVLEAELRSSALAVSAFTCGAVLLT